MSQVIGKCVVFKEEDYEYEFEIFKDSHLIIVDQIHENLGGRSNVFLYYQNIESKFESMVHMWISRDKATICGGNNPPPKQIIAWLNLIGYSHIYK